jgi:hypothetical protein
MLALTGAMLGWVLLLPFRLLWGLVTFAWVLFVGIVSQAGRDDGDADWGRWKTIGRWRHDRHLVTPAIGRRGWSKR